MPSAPHPLISAAQLGAMLLAARKSKRLTQAALAARLGLSQSRVSHLELNAHELSVEQLLAWCAAVGLELTLGVRGGAPVSGTNKTDW